MRTVALAIVRPWRSTVTSQRNGPSTNGPQVLHGDVLHGHAVGPELHVERGQGEGEHVAAVLGVVAPPDPRALPLVGTVADAFEAAFLVEESGHPDVPSTTSTGGSKQRMAA